MHMAPCQNLQFTSTKNTKEGKRLGTITNFNDVKENGRQKGQ
jgi:hypothetical protein